MLLGKYITSQQMLIHIYLMTSNRNTKVVFEGNKNCKPKISVLLRIIQSTSQAGEKHMESNRAFSVM